jgi:hypothetical protein
VIERQRATIPAMARLEEALMKRTLLTAISALSLVTACAVEPTTDEVSELAPTAPTRIFPTKGAGGHGGGGSNLVNHGGPTITNAHVVAIFWGADWTGANAGDAATIEAYLANYGTTGEYNVITQYSGIHQSNLAGGTANWYDTSTPPVNVTDAVVQGEVNAYLATHAFDASAIYEVFLPRQSYSSLGSGSTSCGGPALAFCAYHGSYSNGSVKYASMPYPDCSGCQSAGFSTVQNIEHFISHETREAVTDPDGNAWFDRRGEEADDKCAWSPTPFIDSSTGYAYQYEWSNASSSCVQTM